jgi:hypothetical protein
VLVAVLTLAGCGGSSNSTSEGAPVSDSARIRTAYETFFSSKTNVPAKIRLLQNGPRFERLVKSFYSNPLAKNVNVTVARIQLQGTRQAKVVYTVKLGGLGLPKQTGTAVKENGTWKVGDASLCKLVSLGGSTPSACKS